MALIFAAILLAMLGVAAWTLWFGRRAIREHRDQVREIVEEARRLQAEDRGAGEGAAADGDPDGDPDGAGPTSRTSGSG